MGGTAVHGQPPARGGFLNPPENLLLACSVRIYAATTVAYSAYILSTFLNTNLGQRCWHATTAHGSHVGPRSIRSPSDPDPSPEPTVHRSPPHHHSQSTSPWASVLLSPLAVNG
jgi:hypothetical protein